MSGGYGTPTPPRMSHAAFQHTQFKRASSRSRGGLLFPSIRREYSTASSEADEDDGGKEGPAAGSGGGLEHFGVRAGLFDLVSALALARISEGLYVGLRQERNLPVVLAADWLLWLTSAYSTSNLMDATANRFDADSLPDILISVFNVTVVGAMGMCSLSVAGSVAGSATSLVDSIGQSDSFLSAVLASRIGMLLTLARAGWLDGEATGYCLLRCGQTFAATCGFLALTFVEAHSPAYWAVFACTVLLEAVSLKNVPCCAAVFYSNYVPLDIRQLSARLVRLVWCMCALLLLGCLLNTSLGFTWEHLSALLLAVAVKLLYSDVFLASGEGAMAHASEQSPARGMLWRMLHFPLLAALSLLYGPIVGIVGAWGARESGGAGTVPKRVEVGGCMVGVGVSVAITVCWIQRLLHTFPSLVSSDLSPLPHDVEAGDRSSAGRERGQGQGQSLLSRALQQCGKEGRESPSVAVYGSYDSVGEGEGEGAGEGGDGGGSGAAGLCAGAWCLCLPCLGSCLCLGGGAEPHSLSSLSSLSPSSPSSPSSSSSHEPSLCCGPLAVLRLCGCCGCGPAHGTESVPAAPAGSSFADRLVDAVCSLVGRSSVYAAASVGVGLCCWEREEVGAATVATAFLFAIACLEYSSIVLHPSLPPLFRSPIFPLSARSRSSTLSTPPPADENSPMAPLFYSSRSSTSGGSPRGAEEPGGGGYISVAALTQAILGAGSSSTSSTASLSSSSSSLSSARTRTNSLFQHTPSPVRPPSGVTIQAARMPSDFSGSSDEGSGDSHQQQSQPRASLVSFAFLQTSKPRAQARR